jgi:hypothetical protein
VQSLLADKRLILVLLRLTLDENGRLVHGEVIRPDGSRIGVFHEWRALSPLLDTWAVHQAEEDRWNNPPDPG